MRRKIPATQALLCFDAAARHQNLSRAAEELNMTQSAVSYQIKQIEAFVGAPLFVREARGVDMKLTLHAVVGVLVVIAAVATRLDRLGRDVGRVYAANTVGTIAGSMAAGFALVGAR